MTSIIAWCGVDSRGPASIYIAADSRVTQGRHVLSDGTRKTFAAARSAQIFAYCGHVLGPASTLGSVSETLERMTSANDIATAQEQFREAVEAGWSLHAPVPVETVLLHAVRCGGPAIKTTTFGVQIVRIAAGSKVVDHQVLNVPTSQSSYLAILGSGERAVHRSLARWIPVAQGDGRDRTSRAVFSGFCDSIADASDPNTGGAPQLVGLRRTGLSFTFGVVWEGAPYVSGVPEISENEDIEYFDRHLQRVDRHGRLLPGAQRHAQRPIH
ncbi:hypothetical protein SAMN04489867_3152 [Pedococcus dokdonensis]|uniref:Uncharacterized protein n=1 Tax=Pedococcus dokdonensis TaxID=443156 RepID=A0A1H0U730_9MICO|nr:hypothetical protein SAMN04489867_3152 [Pedococcus dokdonensis]